MSAELKADVRKRIEGWMSSYVEDLKAMSEEDLAKTPGGSARSPYDFTFEVAYVNKRVACRLRSEDPGPPQGEGWVKAPAEFCNKDVAVKALEDSTNEVLAGWDALPGDKLFDKIPLPKGETTPIDMANLVANHLVYHDAQLNYHQALHGDEEVHWKF